VADLAIHFCAHVSALPRLYAAYLSGVHH